MDKIDKDRPNFLSELYDILKPIKYKELYMKLLGKDVYSIQGHKVLFKGTFDEDDFLEDIQIEKVGEYRRKKRIY